MCSVSAVPFDECNGEKMQHGRKTRLSACGIAIVHPTLAKAETSNRIAIQVSAVYYVALRNTPAYDRFAWRVGSAVSSSPDSSERTNSFPSEKIRLQRVVGAMIHLTKQ